MAKSSKSASKQIGLARIGDHPRSETQSRRGRRTASDCERRCAGADHRPGRPGLGRSELAQDRPARPDAARRFPFPREDLPFRPRAHSGAGGARPRLRRARLLRELQAAVEIHPRRPVSARRRAHAGLCAVLDGRGQQGLVRSGARRARVRRQALHPGRQLGHRRQQHPGVLHPGRDQVSRPRPRGEGRAGLRLSAGAIGPRQFLGFHQPDARKHAHDHVGDVGPRASRARSASWKGSASTPSASSTPRTNRPSSNFTGSRSSACSRWCGTRRSRSTAPIRISIAATSGPRSRPAIFRNGSCSSSCSTRPSPTVSTSTSSIPPSSSRKKCCRRSRSAVWCSTGCPTISLPRPNRSRS